MFAEFTHLHFAAAIVCFLDPVSVHDRGNVGGVFGSTDETYRVEGDAEPLEGMSVMVEDRLIIEM